MNLVPNLLPIPSAVLWKGQAIKTVLLTTMSIFSSLVLTDVAASLIEE